MTQLTDATHKAQIEADVTGAPLPREKMDLLWIGTAFLNSIKAVVDSNREPTFIDMGDSSEMGAYLKNVLQNVKAKRLTAADVEWAIGVDAIAGRAEDEARSGNAIGAIAEFRKALKKAPGCDVYLMSMGSCFAQLDMLPEAYRYLQRAAEISPGNAQIARNFTGLKQEMTQRGVSLPRTSAPGFFSRLFGKA